MSSTPDTWQVVADAAAFQYLEPLLAAHRSLRPVRALELNTGEGWKTPADDVAAVLIVGDRRRSPRRALPGLFLRDRSGRRVPAGWLPNVKKRLATFAVAAAGTVARARAGLPRGPLILLGQWEDRSLRLASTTELGFGSETQPLPVFRWTAERIARTDLLHALRGGPGLAIYFGHGRARGWAGYHGVRAPHLEDALGEPLGAVLSLTCHTVNRHKVGLSFAEEMVLMGMCAASLGATGRTRHLDNGCLANNLCSALASSPAATIGDLLLHAGLTDRQADSIYRLIGDPLAPLIGAADSLERARQVFAPAPDDPLPPLPEYEEDLSAA